jgi:hypothetical protein
MKVALCAAALGLGLLAGGPAHAQTVRAEIIIGDPYPRDRVVHVYPRPYRRVVHHYPRVIVVERVHRGRGHVKHHRRNEYRRIRAWYDHDRVRYYDAYRPGLREVVIFESGGRYYDYDYDYRRADYRDYRDDRDYRDYRDDRRDGNRDRDDWDD